MDQAQGELRDELIELRRRQEEKDNKNPHRFPGSDPTGYLDSFYHHVCHGGRHDDRRSIKDLEGPLRTFSANCILPTSVPYFWEL